MQLSAQQILTIRTILTHQPVLKAYVFGSHARGEAGVDSDIDLLVDLDYSQHIGLGFVGMQLELEDALHKKFDLVSSNALSKHLRPFIEKEKMVIYERA